MLAVLVIYFLIEEAIEIKSMGFEYFKSFWNCLDICVICVSYFINFFSVIKNDKGVNY